MSGITVLASHVEVSSSLEVLPPPAGHTFLTTITDTGSVMKDLMTEGRKYLASPLEVSCYSEVQTLQPPAIPLTSSSMTDRWSIMKEGPCLTYRGV